ncbi:MAG: hypothetical protein DI537_31220 [Stutzerimonas stutzeri]|nr:MAG: hypothetical protein DI537_31220 [Stutzerimonas stutzeri]
MTIPIRNDDQILAARAFFTGLDGRAGVFEAGPLDLRRVPWQVDQYGRKISPKTARRPQLDGTVFADPPLLVQSLVTAVAGVNVGLGSTNFAITVIKGSPPKAGNYFEVGGRLYMITQAYGTADQTTTVAIRPPLRTAVFAGYPVALVSPRGPFRLASDDLGGLDLDLGRFATLQLELVEAF